MIFSNSSPSKISISISIIPLFQTCYQHKNTCRLYLLGPSCPRSHPRRQDFEEEEVPNQGLMIFYTYSVGPTVVHLLYLGLFEKNKEKERIRQKYNFLEEDYLSANHLFERAYLSNNM